ncbi:MAG: hypothetical protein WA114_02595 [Psychrobacter glacincola]
MSDWCDGFIDQNEIACQWLSVCCDTPSVAGQLDAILFISMAVMLRVPVESQAISGSVESCH